MLHSLLKEGGKFVQWDWLSQDDVSGMGLSPQRVKQALETNNFTDIKISNPFAMTSSNGDMPVLMALAKKG